MDDIVTSPPFVDEGQQASQQKRLWFMRGTLAALVVVASFLLSAVAAQRWILPLLGANAKPHQDVLTVDGPLVVMIPTQQVAPGGVDASPTDLWGSPGARPQGSNTAEEAADSPRYPLSNPLLPPSLLAEEDLENAYDYKRVPAEHVPTVDRDKNLPDVVESEQVPVATPAEIEADPRYALWPARDRAVPYTIQPGDNITVLAARFKLSPDTLIWANNDSELLNAGDEILIPPLNGVLHTVKEGQTLEEIAQLYKVDPALIAWFSGNDIENPADPLEPGKMLMVPGGVKPRPPEPAPPPAAPRAASRSHSGHYFTWPTGGIITQAYHPHHRGIDIAAAMNTPIFAAQSGEIVYSGWDNTGYGYMILINHHNGWYTRYAHLNAMYVDVGDWVRAKEVIAVMGSTGRSTGPHLHFEIMTRGYRYNPFDYLP